MSFEIKIQVLFSEETGFGTYTDALYFTEEEFKIISEKTIDSLIQERVDAWVNEGNHTSPLPEPTKEDLLNSLQAIEAQKMELDSIKIQIELKISEIDSVQEIK